MVHRCFMWVFPKEMKAEGSPYLVTPTILPGIILTRFSLTAKNAAWGPHSRVAHQISGSYPGQHLPQTLQEASEYREPEDQ